MIRYRALCIVISLKLTLSVFSLSLSLFLSVYAFAGGVDCAAFMIHLSTSSVRSQCSAYILYLYTSITLFGWLLLGCEKYRQTTRFVVVVVVFPYSHMHLYVSWPSAQRQKNIKRGAPLCWWRCSSSALGKNSSATPNISWVRRVGAKNWVN